MNSQTTAKQKQEAVEIQPMGFGNKASNISYEKHRSSGELADDVDTFVVQTITSGSCMSPVSEQDDGCIDGRTAREVVFVDATGLLHQTSISDEVNAAHDRYKVAGGGYITSLAMELAVRPLRAGLDTTLETVVSRLRQKFVFCGGHTGAHANDQSTDCGANDKLELILENALLYRKQIATSIESIMAVAGLTFDAGAQKTSDHNWSKSIAAKSLETEVSTGVSRLHVILDVLRSTQETSKAHRPVAVIKDLEGDHNESYIVINLRRGFTFSQPMLRDQLRDSFPELRDDQLPQVFVVDVARVLQLAELVGEDREQRLQAAQAGLVYQLATAATLTDGSLRTFIVS